MTKIVVLFNLKQGVSCSDYERWARTSDLPTVKKLSSVDDFELLKSGSMLGTDKAPPFEYVEIISVNNMHTFGQEVATDIMQKIAKEFQGFAESPMFILTDTIK